jgi:mitochondrial chaperone BCS1
VNLINPRNSASKLNIKIMSSNPLPPDIHGVLTSYLPAALQGNPYFEAGFGLSLFGTGLAIARGGGKSLLTLTKRHFLVTLEITNKDRSYPWVLSWLTRQASITGGGGRSGSTLAQHVSVVTSVGDGNRRILTPSTPSDDSSSSSSSSSSSTAGTNSISGGSDDNVHFEFAPCPGRHFITYGGRILMVERTR